jgi:hypothetical protein
MDLTFLSFNFSRVSFVCWVGGCYVYVCLTITLGSSGYSTVGSDLKGSAFANGFEKGSSN